MLIFSLILFMILGMTAKKDSNKVDVGFIKEKVTDLQAFMQEVPVPTVEDIAHLLSIQGALLQRESIQMISDAGFLEGNRALMRLDAAVKLAAAATSSYTASGSLLLSIEKARIRAEIENERISGRIREKAIEMATKSDNVVLFENFVAARRVLVGRKRDVELEPGVEKWLALEEKNELG